MKDSSPSTEYLLLFRCSDWDRGLSSEDLQRIMDKTMAWFEREFAKGSVRAAQPLEDSGHVLSGTKGSMVSDGPFAESKEAVAGYMILRAGSIREAMDVAASWPLLEHGSSVEVRPIAEECPISRRMRARSEPEQTLAMS